MISINDAPTSYPHQCDLSSQAGEPAFSKKTAWLVTAIDRKSTDFCDKIDAVNGPMIPSILSIAKLVIRTCKPNMILVHHIQEL